MLAVVNDDADVDLDGGDVEHADLTLLQLVVSLRRSLHASARNVRLVKPSDAMSGLFQRAASEIADGCAAQTAKLGELRTTVHEATGSIDAGRRQLYGAIAAVGTGIRSVSGTVREAREESRVVRGVEGRATRLAETLGAAPVPRVDPDHDAAVLAWFDDAVLPAYGMEEERRLHRDALRACGFAIATAAVEDDEMADIFF